MNGPLVNSFGVTSTVADLRRVLVRTPATTGDWAAAGWREPDTDLLLKEHDAFSQLLTDLGCQVEVAPPVPGLVDAVYMYDSAFVVAEGAIVLASPKPNRVAEAVHAEHALVAAGVPVVGRLTGEARADGGDLMWLDDGTLLAGRTYRTNAAAHAQLAELLARSGQRLVRADMPHDRGSAHVLHLMSVVSMISERLAVVFEPLSPVPLLEELRDRDIEWIAVEEDDYLAMGVNVLAVRPGVVVMVDGTPRVRSALEALGVEVHVFDGSQLSLKGDGGPTCLTRPLWRSSHA